MCAKGVLVSARGPLLVAAILLNGVAGTAIAQQTPMGSPRNVVPWLRAPDTPVSEVVPALAGPVVIVPNAAPNTAPVGQNETARIPPLPGGVAPSASIQSRGLAAAPVAAAGTLSPDQAGLPADLWVGTPAASLTRLTDGLVPTPLLAANDLMRRALALRADVPADAGAGLLVSRLEAMGRLGAYSEVEALGRSAGIAPSSASSVFVDAMLISGRHAEICPALVLQAKQGDQVTRRRAFCLALTGQKARALTEIALLRDQGKGDEILDLIEAVADQTLAEYVDTEAAAPHLLSVLAAQQMKKPLPKSWVEVAQKLGDLGLAHLALDVAQPPRTRLTIAEKLSARGAAVPELWQNLVAELAPAESGGVWGRGEAIRGVNRLRGPAQARAVVNAMRGAAEAGTEALMAQVIANDAARLQPGLETFSIQPLLRRLFLLAGRPNEARQYLTSDPDVLSRAIDRVVDPDWAGVWGEPEIQMLQTRRKQGDARAALMLAALAGLGLDPDASTDVQSAEGASLAALVQQGEKGAALLGVLGWLGRDQGPMALAGSLAVLRGIGLEEDARRIAVELLLR